MKGMIVAVIMAVVCFGVYAGENDGWLTDFDKAKEIAKQENRPILIDFSGSDWCGWCIKLDKEVFSQEEFKKFAADNLVLLLMDFPRRKEIASEVKKRNEALLQKYNVEGFPTVLLVDSEGNVIARTGYQEGGAAKYVEHIKKLLEKK